MQGGELSSKEKEPNGPVERALEKFSQVDGLPLVAKMAVERLIETYRSFRPAQGRELTPSEMRNFLREMFPLALEKFFSLVAQEEALDAAAVRDAEAKAGGPETGTETPSEKPPATTG